MIWGLIYGIVGHGHFVVTLVEWGCTLCGSQLFFIAAQSLVARYDNHADHFIDNMTHNNY